MSLEFIESVVDDRNFLAIAFSCRRHKGTDYRLLIRGAFPHRGLYAAIAGQTKHSEAINDVPSWSLFSASAAEAETMMLMMMCEQRGCVRHHLLLNGRLLPKNERPSSKVVLELISTTKPISGPENRPIWSSADARGRS